MQSMEPVYISNNKSIPNANFKYTVYSIYILKYNKIYELRN